MARHLTRKTTDNGKRETIARRQARALKSGRITTNRNGR